MESWEGLLLMTDVSTTCVEAIFRVKWPYRVAHHDEYPRDFAPMSEWAKFHVSIGRPFRQGGRDRQREREGERNVGTLDHMRHPPATFPHYTKNNFYIIIQIVSSMWYCCVLKHFTFTEAYEQEHATPLYFCHGVFIDRFIFSSNLLWMILPWECHSQSQDDNWRHCVTGPELPFFHKRKGVLKIDQSVKMPWHRLSMGVASSCSSAPDIYYIHIRSSRTTCFKVQLHF